MLSFTPPVCYGNRAMKRLLLLSLAMNLLLAGLVGRLVARRPVLPTALPVGVDAPARQLVVTNTVSFHWSQVESVYYPVYIANLRSIGCPEQTINDLITADLKSVFDARRRAARARAASTNEAARLAASLEREEIEARRLVLPPVGTRGGQATTYAEASHAAATTAHRAAESLSHDELLAYFTRRDATDGQMKLIYADIYPTDAELRQLYELSVKFDDEFGKNQPDLTDVDWEKRRRTALRQMEDQLRSAVGYPRFNEYLREAVMRGQTLP